MTFKRAVKRDAKLRLALCGAAGSGKTYSLLSIATGLGGPIAYVDTEHGSASKYADIFQFDVIEPDVFDPRELIDCIAGAAANGYKVICVDSLSHYWMGKGGELELVDGAAKRSQSGNSFTAWKTVTPIHNALVDTIIAAPIHVLVSMRTKTEWVIEKDEKGRSTPRKIGLAPIMRDGIEFEFDVCGDLDQDNTLTVTKSRCPDLTGKVINRPGKDLARTLKKWLTGAPAEEKQPGARVVTVDQAHTVAAGLDGRPPAEAAGPDPAEPTAAVDVLAVEFRKLDKFGRLKVLGELKRDLSEVTGDTAEYYRILGLHGIEHANKIQSMNQGLLILREIFLSLQAHQYAIVEPCEEGEVENVA